ncbi:hypothetical protein ACF0H5_017715 [Mactra antiquata]
MELSIIRPAKLVVALDIGSTYSGYAWQYRDEFEAKREPHFNTNWSAGALQLHKTKTCLMIKCQDKASRKPSDELSPRLDPSEIEDVKIGHDAENTYMKIAKMKSHELLGKYYLFSRFKMRLYEKGFADDILVEDQLSQILPLFDVMTLFIRELKQHCLQKINEKRQSPVNEKETLFVVTVPAIWSDCARDFMRKAAIKAGSGKRNVLLALEPEAAAISCIHLTSQQKKDMNNFGDVRQRFLVADLGGGTADLSAVEVQKDGTLKELSKSHGNNAGGQNINDAFMQHCHDSFQGKKWQETFSNVTPSDAVKMEANFEKSKVQIGSTDSDGQMIEVEIPTEMRRGIENKSITLKKDCILQYNDPEFVFKSDFVRKTLFQTTCDMIYNTIKNVLSRPETKGIKTVILVGGFSESPIVIETLRGKVGKDFPGVKLVVPDSPFKSVLLGAVLYGHDPMIFSSRISRETYGVDVDCIFDETKHDASKKWWNKETKEYWCEDLFDIHVKKGESVSLLKSQPKQVYNPISKDQTSVYFGLYSSSSINPMYITDEGCKQIGQLEVEMPDTAGGTDREVEVSMLYGGTQIAVLAKDVNTGKEVNAEIVFGKYEER